MGLALIWSTSRKLNESDRLRQEAEEEIRKINSNLEQLVKERTKALHDSIAKLVINENELKRNQSLIKGIIDHAGASIFVKDLQGRYILANSRFTENFQLSSESIRMKTAHDIFPKSVADQLVSDEQSIIQTAASITTQIHVQTATEKNAIMITNKFPLLDENKQVYAIAVISTDITKQKMTEANLQAIFDSAWVSIIKTDINGIITQFNRGAELLLGYQADEVVGKHTPQLFHLIEEVDLRGKELSVEWSRPIHGFDVFVERARQGTFDSREWTYVKKDGTQFPVQLVVSGVRGEDQSIHGFLGIATDITKLREQQEIIKLQNDKLEQLNNTKDKFFSIVAHDLKSPLNSLMAFSSLLINHIEALSKDDILKMSQQLRSSVDNTIKMADNLITWARLQMNDIQPSPEMVPVQEVVLNVCHVYKTVASDKEIQVDCMLNDTLFFWGDRNQIEFAIRNLVNNAIKFTPSGGIVKLVAKQHEENSIEIAVIDNGVGMPSNRLNSLFSLGTKHSYQGTAGERGTGLGLMLTSEFVKLNHGQLLVESIEGKGTSFRIILNCVETTPSSLVN